MLRIRPGSKYFVGRDVTADKLLSATRKTNAVLLFGGRQAGKTSLLLHLRDRLATSRADVRSIGALDLPVYVDLTTLRYDAQPEDFFVHLLARATSACRAQIDGFEAQDVDRCSSIDAFASALTGFREKCGEVDIRLVFFLDEAKRVLSERFPRGFQDNLFALLFGELSDTANTVMVFAGAQHLLEFFKDETSPIGSRAIAVLLSNLTHADVSELANKALAESRRSQLTDLIDATWIETGGHAGLVARFLETADTGRNDGNGIQIATNIAEDCLGLFENWTLSLTAEALHIALALVSHREVRLQAVVAQLDAKGLNRFLARRVFDELTYTGIGVVEGDCLRRCGNLFWGYFSQFGAPREIGENGQGLWTVIEQTELALRRLIKIKIEEKYGDTSVETMRRILGETAWSRILAVKDKSDKQYRLSRDPPTRELMSCMYLGQLGSLMISGETWGLFKALFRDKRELEDKLAAISPVRNDRAHFSVVPEKELARCRIACDDLSVIVERALEELAAAII